MKPDIKPRIDGLDRLRDELEITEQSERFASTELSGYIELGQKWKRRADAAEARVAELEYVTNSQSAKLDEAVDLRVEMADLRAKLAAKDAELAEAKGLINWNLHLHHGISRDSDWQGSPADAEWDNCLTQMHAAIDDAKKEEFAKAKSADYKRDADRERRMAGEYED